MSMVSDIFAIYKPKGKTSNDVVNEIKRITNEKKVGHAGTLDPLATGVLIIGVGREATKKLKDIVKKEKEYLTTIKLGIESTTDDEEGEKTEFQVQEIPSEKEIKKVTSEFKGIISQVPPIFSAIKIKGREAYKYARSGQKIELEPREVEIKKIEIINYEWPYLKLKIITGPGFYVRSLARDIGKKLKTGGYVYELERIRVGDFTKEKAMTVSEFSSFFKKKNP